MLLSTDASTRDNVRDCFYREGINILRAAQIPFLVSGAFAVEKYTGIRRKTKDLDIFVCKKDVHGALRAYATAGYRAELKFSHWLGKVYHPTSKDYIDIIFSSGNGLCEVDLDWFNHAVAGTMLQIPVQFPAPEEIIWQKAFVMERERYDGADVAHLLRAESHSLDWHRLLRRFANHWRVLMSHLILFGYIYPGERTKIPNWVHDKLVELLKNETHDASNAEPVCQGTLLSRMQYRTDIEVWGYRDPRLHSNMTSREVANWTADGEDVSKQGG
jgi:hypothetical protein